jgi:hypothetical protein
MVNIIASRAAAIKLSSIIAALLLPILFLGYFLITTLQRDSDINQRELDGAALIHLLIPVYLNAVGDESKPSDTSALLEKGPQLAQAVGVSAAFENLAEILNTAKPHPGAVMANTLEIITRTGDIPPRGFQRIEFAETDISLP